MKDLRIFDVSTYIHAGKVNRRSFLQAPLLERDDMYVERRLYTGGTSFLWNTIYEVYGTADLVFCCDTRPTVKQSMYGYYKGSRAHDDGVSKQKRIAEYILRDCGLEVLKEDGYEADDFIYSVVRDKKREYDHIYIYTADSDLYFLVSDNVTVLPSSSRAKMVTKDNYTYTAGKKDSYTPYNSMTFSKILFGDSSDDIPPLPADTINMLHDLLWKDPYFKVMGDKETMLQILTPFGEEVVNQCNLVFPMDMRVPEEFSKGDKIRIAEWGNAMNNKLWRSSQPVPQHIKDCILEMCDLGYYSEE